ncbi:MAG: TRAP transporter small permease subunit [Gammaproteobacteria bacterium]
MNSLYRIVNTIDTISENIGRVVAWLTLGMVGVMFIVVVLRYVFDTGSIAVQESVTYLHALVFMFGASYTLRHDEHVRVDVFYQSWSVTIRAKINLAGSLLFLLPLTAVLFWLSMDYVIDAWRVKEGSRQTGGLPFIYLLKSVIPLTAALLFMQGLAETLRSVAQLSAGTLHNSAAHHQEKL